MNALEKAFRGELAEIAADGVLGEVKFGAEIFGDDRSGFPEGVQDMFATVAGEHSSTIA